MSWFLNKFNENIVRSGLMLGSVFVLAVSTVGCQKKDKSSPDTKEETHKEDAQAEDADANTGEFRLDEGSDTTSDTTESVPNDSDIVRQVTTDKDSVSTAEDSTSVTGDSAIAALPINAELLRDTPTNRCHELEGGIPLDPAAYDAVAGSTTLAFEELPIFSFNISPTLCYLKQALTHNSNINDTVDSFFASDATNATEDLMQIGLLLRQIVEYEPEDMEVDYAINKVSAFTAFVENRIESDRVARDQKRVNTGIATALVSGIVFSSAGVKVLNRIKNGAIIRAASSFTNQSPQNKFVISLIAGSSGFLLGHQALGRLVFSPGEFAQLTDQELLIAFREAASVQEMIEILSKAETSKASEVQEPIDTLSESETTSR